MGKIRVYELAKDLGVNSKDLLEKMQQIGLSAKNYMSTLEDKEIGQLQEALMKKEMPPSRPEKKPVAPKDVKSEKPALTSGTTTSGTGREKEAGATGTIQRSAEQPERNRGSVKTAQASSPTRAGPGFRAGKAHADIQPGKAGSSLWTVKNSASIQPDKAGPGFRAGKAHADIQPGKAGSNLWTVKNSASFRRCRSSAGQRPGRNCEQVRSQTCGDSENNQG